MDPIPFAEDYLPEQDGHQVHFSRYGTAGKLAIVVLHGGPGSQSKPKHIKNYDLSQFEVVAFDQRGCGKSLPLGSAAENTTQKLIEDIERLREHLGFSTWFVAGSSWGSALALAYAQAHKDRVSGLLLGSVFLARPKDTQWAFMEGGVSSLFPDVWERYAALLSKYGATPETAGTVLLEKMESGDEMVVAEIAAGVSGWEGNLISNLSDVSYMNPAQVGAGEIAAVKIALHYLKNNYFLSEDQLLVEADTISDMRTVIVHGRYDILCPAESSWTLAKKLKNARVVFLPLSAHRLTPEAEIARAEIFNSTLKAWSA